MKLTPALQAAIEETLRAAGDTSPIRVCEAVGGGSINQAFRMTTAHSVYFVKWHAAPPPSFIACEARGLSLIAATTAVRVPQVVGEGKVEGGSAGYLILEWIDPGPRTDQAARTLGRQFAQMHRYPQSRYGLDHDNFIGSTLQKNTQSDSWLEFFRSQRLAAQRDLALRTGKLPPHRARLLDRLIEMLEQWIDESACQPSLLHGDLWGGNWMAAASGQPVLIDPAVYVGDREADLAMTSLFGGFPPAFYASYNDVFLLSPGYQDREPIYQLYHQLNHLNLFGEGYGGGIDRSLARLVGHMG